MIILEILLRYSTSQWGLLNVYSERAECFSHAKLALPTLYKHKKTRTTHAFGSDALVILAVHRRLTDELAISVHCHPRRPPLLSFQLRGHASTRIAVPAIPRTTARVFLGPLDDLAKSDAHGTESKRDVLTSATSFRETHASRAFPISL